MAVVPQHLPRNVSGNLHDGFVPRAAFRQFGDECVSVVVPTAFHFGVFSDAFPGSLERCHMACWIRGHGPAKREQIPLILNFSKPLLIPGTILNKRVVEFRVQRNRTALPRFSFCPSDAEEFGLDVDLRPGESLDFGVS